MNKIKPRIKPEMAFTESNQTLENRTNPNSEIRKQEHEIKLEIETEIRIRKRT